jgi:hypothetical protein
MRELRRLLLSLYLIRWDFIILALQIQEVGCALFFKHPSNLTPSASALDRNVLELQLRGLAHGYFMDL